jgi:hypothetical protein
MDDLKDEQPDFIQEHIPHQDRKTAFHMEWKFRREAVVWIGTNAARVNFYPFATELRNWMLRKPDRLGIFLATDQQLTNQYSYDASILTNIFQYIVNEGANFPPTLSGSGLYEAEVRRIRLFGEYVLYTARLCEAFIKQLLFLTSFPESYYRSSALGSLSTKDCDGCRNSKGKRHKLSLLGSLAHRYHRCDAFEHCLDPHMSLVNRRRNLEAAHSGISPLNLKPIDELSRQFQKDFLTAGEDLVHMLLHISDIETNVLNELSALIQTR